MTSCPSLFNRLTSFAAGPVAGRLRDAAAGRLVGNNNLTARSASLLPIHSTAATACCQQRQPVVD